MSLFLGVWASSVRSVYWCFYSTVLHPSLFCAHYGPGLLSIVRCDYRVSQSNALICQHRRKNEHCCAICTHSHDHHSGSHTSVCLVQAGARVTIVDDLSNSFMEVLSRLEKLLGPLFSNITFKKVWLSRLTG